MTTLRDKKVALVVTGGIAAYKSAELARMLIREGAHVRVAMTRSAGRFITPLTFQTLTQHPVAEDMWAPSGFEIDHISLADWADAVVIAPATANIIGKLAGGVADDFVSTFLLAVRAPVLVCPAMNVNMYDHPAVQANLQTLRERGVTVVEPGQGFLACGWEGKGRLADLPDIVEAVVDRLSPHDLEGLSVMVTAGPTREAWDDIRYISNRSSGLMGYSLALAARRRGAKVILVSGPVNAKPPAGVETIHVESTRDMRRAVLDHFQRVHILVKAAAPGDFRPATRVKGKVKKNDVPPPIELDRNPDILKEVGAEKGDRIVVGFAAESEHLIENASAKLKSKNMDLVVANQIGPADESFGAETNRVWLIDRDDHVEELPLMSKLDVAHRIWDRVLILHGEKTGHGTPGTADPRGATA